MEVAEDFERIHPGFEVAGFVAEQGGVWTDDRQKFPRTRGAREFQILCWRGYGRGGGYDYKDKNERFILIGPAGRRRYCFIHAWTCLIEPTRV
jgi:hypothetical protein